MRQGAKRVPDVGADRLARRDPEQCPSGIVQYADRSTGVDGHDTVTQAAERDGGELLQVGHQAGLTNCSCRIWRLTFLTALSTPSSICWRGSSVMSCCCRLPINATR